MHVVLLKAVNQLTTVMLTDNIAALKDKESLSQKHCQSYHIQQLRTAPVKICPHCETNILIDSSFSEADSVTSEAFFMYININLQSFLDNYVNDGWQSLSSLRILVPHYVSAANASHVDEKYSRTLIFPKHLTSVGEQVYSYFYCRQIKYSGQVMSSSKVYGVCVVYVSHLLREEVAHLTHLAKTSPPSKTDNAAEPKSDITAGHIFNSWRGDPAKEGQPGISIHVNDSDFCTEPVFCDRGKNIQDAVFRWQNPPVTSSVTSERTCDNSKYVVFMSTFRWASIGSWIHQTAVLMQYAMCHDRILLLPTKRILERVHAHMQALGPGYADFTTHSRWIHDKCLPEDSVFDCYFKSVSSCIINEEEYLSTFVNYAGSEPFLDEVLTSDAKYVSISFIPFVGSCAIGAKSWEGSFRFFKGMDVGLGRYVEKTKLHEWAPVHSLVNAGGSGDSGAEYGAFAGSDSFPMKAQLLRYLLRPKR